MPFAIKIQTNSATPFNRYYLDIISTTSTLPRHYLDTTSTLPRRPRHYLDITSTLPRHIFLVKNQSFFFGSHKTIVSSRLEDLGFFGGFWSETGFFGGSRTETGRKCQSTFVECSFPMITLALDSGVAPVCATQRLLGVLNLLVGQVFAIAQVKGWGGGKVQQACSEVWQQCELRGRNGNNVDALSGRKKERKTMARQI